MSPIYPITYAPNGVLSIYGAKGGIGSSRSTCAPLAALSMGLLIAGAGKALDALDAACWGVGADLRVSDCWRDSQDQAEVHARYLAWVDAGKPAPGHPDFDPARHKPAYVAPPGGSLHEAGRAVDVDIARVVRGLGGRAGIAEGWRRWRALLLAHGWRSIVSESAGPSASEAWHIEWWGDLELLRLRQPYGIAARVAVLCSRPSLARSEVELRQAYLHRAGFDPGALDGEDGPRTRAAVAAAGTGDLATLARMPAK